MDSHQFVSAIEDERARIARELHDDIAQRLALNAIELRLLYDDIPATELEYGCIEVGPAVQEELLQVRAFHEKPPRLAAERLLSDGALWNTFVMVGHISAFLQMASATEPGLIELFKSAIRHSRKTRETRIPESLCEWFSPLDFSRHILSPAAKRLVALRLRNIQWHDLGDPERVLSTLLSKSSEPPAWAKRWQAKKPAAETATCTQHAVA